MKAARHVEIWGHLEENNRFWRRFGTGMLVWSFLALALGTYGMLVGMFRPLAFHVDLDGRATFVGRLREDAAPGEAEVRFVARTFLDRYVAFNSLTIESDMADAWNLMTSELRAQQEQTLAAYEKEHGESFVGFVKGQGIQTVLELDGKRTELTDHNGKVFTVRTRGVARTWPLNRGIEDAATSERELEAIVTLVRCPRTEATPNGLLVAKVVNRLYEAAEAGAEE